MRLLEAFGMRRLASVGVVGLLAAGVLACGGEQKVDLKKAQKLIESNLMGGGATDVRCPKNVTYKKGRTFECNVSATSVTGATPLSAPAGTPPPTSSKSYTVTVHMIGNGKLEVSPSDLHEV